MPLDLFCEDFPEYQLQVNKYFHRPRSLTSAGHRHFRAYGEYLKPPALSEVADWLLAVSKIVEKSPCNLIWGALE
jgi:hypothetical protein